MTPPLVDTVKIYPSMIEGHGAGFAVDVYPYPKTEQEITQIADAIHAAVKELRREVPT